MTGPLDFQRHKLARDHGAKVRVGADDYKYVEISPRVKLMFHMFDVRLTAEQIASARRVE